MTSTGMSDQLTVIKDCITAVTCLCGAVVSGSQSFINIEIFQQIGFRNLSHLDSSLKMYLHLYF